MTTDESTDCEAYASGYLQALEDMRDLMDQEHALDCGTNQPYGLNVWARIDRLLTVLKARVLKTEMELL